MIKKYRLKVKINFNYFKSSAMLDIIKRIKVRGIPLYIYDPYLENGSGFYRSEVVNDLDRFKSESDVILANRFDEEVLGDVAEKVYTGDLFRRD